MSELKEERISDADVVSGWYFRKFVNDYKAYDAKQKEFISQQNKTIENLRKRVRELESDKKLTDAKKELKGLYGKLEKFDIDAVTFKQAKMLRDLGYSTGNGERYRCTTHCYAIYPPGPEPRHSELLSNSTFDAIVPQCYGAVYLPAPTLRQAWIFLEEKGIDIYVFRRDNAYVNSFSDKEYRYYRDAVSDAISAGCVSLRRKNNRAIAQ